MARTQAEKLWIGGGAFVAALLAAGMWAMAVGPELSGVDSIRTQTENTRTQNEGLASNVGKLKNAYADIADLRLGYTAAQAALPADSALSEFTKQVGAQAKAGHVALTSLSVGAPTPVGAKGSAAPAPGAKAAPGGIYEIPITLVTSGSTAADLRFLDSLQHKGPRAALVTNVSMTGQGSGSDKPATSVTMTVQLQVFVAPAAAHPASK